MAERIATSSLRFALCLGLATCLWLTSVIFRTGTQAPRELDAFAIATAAFSVGAYRLYATRPVFTLLSFTLCPLLIHVADHAWDEYGYFDAYKGLENYTSYAAKASVVLAAASFGFKVRTEPGKWALPLSWGAFATTAFAIASHMLIPHNGMLGPRYVGVVFIAMIGAEVMRLIGRSLSGPEEPSLIG